MGFLNPPTISTPRVPDPEPVEITDETPEEVRLAEARKRRARRGRRETVVTGALSPGISGKKTLLG